MAREENLLDIILVPMGFAIMAAYHVYLVYRIVKHPKTTVIGINVINRRAWVHVMMKTLRNHIMASTLLASTAITLCSVLALLLANTGNGGVQVQRMSVRYYSPVSSLISIPPDNGIDVITREYVSSALTRGAHLWSLGLRAYYFSLPLFLWNFRPIAMFISSCMLVSILNFFDTTKDFNRTFDHGSLEEGSMGLSIAK
eukprot:Gb_19193 [translate_table: standard]